MEKCLYLVCPTDCLESIINETFRQENYFYTSLGNSFCSDSKTLEYIRTFIQENHIKKICFVLSINNRIVLDGLGVQNFSAIEGLNSFYDEILVQKERSKPLWHNGNPQFSTLSYYLNQKINALRLELRNASDFPVEISGKIFHQNDFKPIYSDLVCIEKCDLN